MQFVGTKETNHCVEHLRVGARRLAALVLAAPLILAAVPKARALGEAGDLAAFHGIWTGNSVIAERQPRAALVAARDIGLAIRDTPSGFEMVWQSLSREGAARTTAQFLAASEPGIFTATSVEPPLNGKEELWAQMEGDRLVVYLSDFDGDDLERVARYALSISDGRMAFSYTLSRRGEVVESVAGSLSRAKIIF